MRRAQRMNGKLIDSTGASAIVKHSLLGLLLGPAPACPQAPASEAMSPELLYEVITETVMPHLEENLRYVTTRETRCVAQQDLFDAFPILHHPSLQGCRLGNET